VRWCVHVRESVRVRKSERKSEIVCAFVSVRERKREKEKETKRDFVCVWCLRESERARKKERESKSARGRERAAQEWSNPHCGRTRV